MGGGADPVADAQFQPPRTVSEGEARDLSPVCTTERVSSLLVVTQPYRCRPGILTWLPAPAAAPVTRARPLSKLPREEQSSAPRAAEASRGWTASGTELAGLPGLGHPGRGWGRAGRLAPVLGWQAHRQAPPLFQTPGGSHGHLWSPWCWVPCSSAVWPVSPGRWFAGGKSPLRSGSPPWARLI